MIDDILIEIIKHIELREDVISLLDAYRTPENSFIWRYLCKKYYGKKIKNIKGSFKKMFNIYTNTLCISCCKVTTRLNYFTQDKVCLLCEKRIVKYDTIKKGDINKVFLISHRKLNLNNLKILNGKLLRSDVYKVLVSYFGNSRRYFEYKVQYLKNRHRLLRTIHINNINFRVSLMLKGLYYDDIITDLIELDKKMYSILLRSELITDRVYNANYHNVTLLNFLRDNDRLYNLKDWKRNFKHMMLFMLIRSESLNITRLTYKYAWFHLLKCHTEYSEVFARKMKLIKLIKQTGHKSPVNLVVLMNTSNAYRYILEDRELEEDALEYIVFRLFLSDTMFYEDGDLFKVNYNNYHAYAYRYITGNYLNNKLSYNKIPQVLKKFMSVCV